MRIYADVCVYMLTYAVQATGALGEVGGAGS
jgi:hypothetical protein